MMVYIDESPPRFELGRSVAPNDSCRVESRGEAWPFTDVVVNKFGESDFGLRRVEQMWCSSSTRRATSLCTANKKSLSPNLFTTTSVNGHAGLWDSTRHESFGQRICQVQMRVAGTDIDHHDDGPPPLENESAAISLYQALKERGHDCIL